MVTMPCLEAYDITTGDVITATAGASGGFAGAGYNYTLLYLSGDDNTAIVSESGLQNTPTFIGDSGGYISEGWYAIEISSSFGCSYVTEPYYVIHHHQFNLYWFRQEYLVVEVMVKCG